MSGKKKILVIDDDADIVGLLCDIFKKQGYEVAAAFDGEEGWNQAGAFQPDLAVVDIMMPKIHGFDLVQKLRADARFAAMKILVVSAKRYVADERAALAMGADQYLRKPYDAADIQAAVKGLLSD